MYETSNPFGHHRNNNSKTDRIYQCGHENKSQCGSTIVQRSHLAIFLKLLQSKQDKLCQLLKTG
jgi:hypothetical protein